MRHFEPPYTNYTHDAERPEHPARVKIGPRTAAVCLRLTGSLRTDQCQLPRPMLWGEEEEQAVMNYVTRGDKFQALPVVFGTVPEPRQHKAGPSCNAEVRPRTAFHHFRPRYPRLRARRKWTPRVVPEDIINFDPPKEAAASLPFPFGPEAAVVAETATSRQVKRRSGEQSAVGCGCRSGCHYGCHKWRSGTLPTQGTKSECPAQEKREAYEPHKQAAISGGSFEQLTTRAPLPLPRCTCTDLDMHLCTGPTTLVAISRLTYEPLRINNMTFTKSSSERSSGNSSYNGGNKAFRQAAPLRNHSR
ncbi:hypothetical protein HPB51_023512 [Rhipicephalus microplus]|uniref:Uncharacterized protein n=1 Tax=Rhipicephalus microplus TaxID=6941 RepID=A0A9J6EIY9_RHIMP|nr:hypothetical protein HPB51_023512 [Rhipicephalus microplus]